MRDYSGFGDVAPEQYGILRDREKRILKRQSKRAGLCVVAFVILQYALPYVIFGSPIVSTLYNENEAFAGLVGMLYYLLSMFLPFAVAYVFLKPHEKQEVDFFQKPISKGAAVSAVISGFFFCTIGDFVNNYFIAFLEAFGFSLEGGVYESPKDGAQLIITIFSIAILPALIEEFALRSIIMQPLRRLGDKFAVVMTAFVFALMHGNLVQIPFAFIAGIAIGYFVIATDSIWVGVAIHMLNNGFSVLLNYLLQVRPTAAETVYNLVTSVAVVAGIIATACFVKVQNHVRLQKPICAMTAGEKTSAYLCTVPMLAAILLLIIETCKLVSYTGIVQ